MAQFATVRNDDAGIFQQYLNFTATQGGVSAFVQTSISTGLTPDLGIIAVIDSIIFEVTTAIGIAVVGTSPDFEVTVTRATKAAIPDLSDADLLAKYKYKMGNLAATGLPLAVMEGPVALVIPGKQIIVGPTVFVQLDTTGFTVVQTIVGRVNYHTEKMSKQSILEILYG